MDHTPQDQQPSVAADVDHAAAEQTPPLVARQDPGWPPVEDTAPGGQPVPPKALTMAKHRRSASVRFTLCSPRLTEWVDLRSGITHLLSPEAAKAGQRTHSRYPALCGHEVLPSDSTPPIGGCQPCHGSMPTQRSRASRSRQTSSPKPVKRARVTGMVDAQTSVEHLITDRAMTQHQHSGRYLTLCGIEILAHSLTAPPHGRCIVCADAT
jgi:hypothetical protein